MVTIVLMIAQAFIFERLSTALVNWGRQRGTSSQK